MSKYLLDTDYIKKRKGANGKNIRRWEAGVDDRDFAISALSIFEVSRGIALKQKSDAALARTLQESLDLLRVSYAGRIIPVDEEVAEIWGQVAGSDRGQWIDRGLVATAIRHGLILLSCNSNDTKGLGAEVINPEREKVGHWSADGTDISGPAAKPSSGAPTG